MDERIFESQPRWHARPIRAGLVRAVATILPIGASVGFVYGASRLVHPPTSSLGLYVGWWLALSAAATLVLAGVSKISRRLLPLAALLRLSLVFPDCAPSRFRTALEAGTVKTLEERLTEARRGDPNITPGEAARRLLALVAALDTHDSLTRGHSERVRAYAQMIGRELGLKPCEVELLNWAALLHDVGKLEIPRKILTKKGRPTDEEWAAIRRHPELGEVLVAPLREWLGVWSDAVGYHHEQWDGGGYPRALAGTDIPLAGRIVAVADVFDVITSSRSYKEAASATAGRKEIARCAGMQFDPEVVRAFLALSLGRARFAVGPFAWLADAAILARAPMLSTVGTVSAAAVAVASPGLLVQNAAPFTHRSTAEATHVVTVAGLRPAEPLPAAARSGHDPKPTATRSVGASSAASDQPAGDRQTSDQPFPNEPVTTRPAAVHPTSDQPTPAQPVPIPSAPATPPIPSTPTLPTVPAIPSLPPVLAIPLLPPVPAVLSLPLVPSVAAIPSVPTLPDAPSTPSASSLPTVPPIPSLPSVPSVPSTPSVPSLPGT